MKQEACSSADQGGEAEAMSRRISTRAMRGVPSCDGGASRLTGGRELMVATFMR